MQVQRVVSGPFRPSELRGSEEPARKRHSVSWRPLGPSHFEDGERRCSIPFVPLSAGLEIGDLFQRVPCAVHRRESVVRRLQSPDRLMGGVQDRGDHQFVLVTRDDAFC